MCVSDVDWVNEIPRSSVIQLLRYLSSFRSYRQSMVMESDKLYMEA
jgi:hypothetical protein